MLVFIVQFWAHHLMQPMLDYTVYQNELDLKKLILLVQQVFLALERPV